MVLYTRLLRISHFRRIRIPPKTNTDSKRASQKARVSPRKELGGKKRGESGGEGAGGEVVDMRDLAEAPTSSPSMKDPNFDPDITMTIPDSEQIEAEEVAYLRDTDVRLLHPAYSWIQEQRHPIQGTAHQFVHKLQQFVADRNHRMRHTPEQKQRVYLMDIRRYLASHGEVDLAQNIKSREDIRNLPNTFFHCFKRKSWFLNENLSPEEHDEYQLLSLGYRDGHVDGNDELIPDLWLLNFVGNSLKADLQYTDFFNRLNNELHWDDTEEQGVRKTIEIRDKYFPDIKDFVIPWVLQDWAQYNTNLYNYLEKINKNCQLWCQDEGEEDYSKMDFDSIKKSADPWIKYDFDEVKEYIARRTLKGCTRSTGALINTYFEAKEGEPKPDGGDYLLFVKEKIRMAVNLGIIQKENVEKSEAGSQLLKDIEHYNPKLFSCGCTPFCLRNL